LEVTKVIRGIKAIKRKHQNVGNVTHAQALTSIFTVQVKTLTRIARPIVVVIHFIHRLVLEIVAQLRVTKDTKVTKVTKDTKVIKVTKDTKVILEVIKVTKAKVIKEKRPHVMNVWMDRAGPGVSMEPSGITKEH
jgi:hypothetical protein